MKFNLSAEKVDNIKEYVIKMLKKELMYQDFWALRDVSFEVEKGDRLTGTLIKLPNSENSTISSYFSSKNSLL